MERRCFLMKKWVVIMAIGGFFIAGTFAAIAATLWACSNHSPQHVAQSPAEVQQLTQQYGCSGWRSL